MKTKKTLYLGIAAAALAALLTACLSTQGTGSVGESDIGGVVTGPSGPEAGVWVIAETTDLSTKFAKLVVTDDRGRFLIPDLPKASYSVWVRGYGLVDSPKVSSTPGKTLNLTAVPAPRAAAGRRAQHGRDDVGFFDAEILSPRRHLDRPRQPQAQRQRPDLRRARGEHRHGSGARPGEAPPVLHQAPRSQSQDAVLHGIADAAVGLLGQGAHLGRPLEHSQRDDG